MTNVDLNMALDRVRDLRAEIEFYSDLRSEAREDGDKETFDSASVSVRDARLKLEWAQHELADVMLTIQAGYDLALLPKAQVKS